ncbi:hypothetical protein PSECIP111951_01479 [Pseudoalteromonas holothuriae]|uniref:Uncharacterized protein n=1 Tax=Pseudoalteromonas holothuriae TaxID=2963714 RepID=A0A9W4R1W9_9GAMM|nr:MULTISPECIES: hypothetical protein [unclassified Pseudoalteromonas]CAH9056524.1 hypothetical protein PSECIP111951_01479 [Pseudoalteromonas sp. CIP111951]CAH9062981.1 hypothetical protein PSECIP111854_03133 [Pseudoalteromonas sp. CIP111854]
MGFATEMSPYYIVGTIFMMFVQLFLAYGVYHEAEQLKQRQQKLWFVGSFFWFLLTLSVGILAAVAFWLMHCSNLKETPLKPR